jgi:hypothetical protein
MNTVQEESAVFVFCVVMAVFLKILNGFQYLSSIKSADFKIALYDIVLAHWLSMRLGDVTINRQYPSCAAIKTQK